MLPRIRLSPLAARHCAEPVARSSPYQPLAHLRPTPFNKRAIILTNSHTLGAIMPNENSYEVALQKSNAIREGLAKTP